jgi:phosphoadenosine phosphosulfate reductase
MSLVEVLPRLPEIPDRGRDELRELAEEGARKLADRDALVVIDWAARTFGTRLCVTSSMADAVVAHLVAQVVPGVEVLFVDTGYHFAETLGTRDAVDVVLPVRVRTLRPELTVAEQNAQYGPRLYERDPDLCCALRKVAPLRRALTEYDAWVTGVRRDETAARAGVQVVQWDEGNSKVKVNPIAHWSARDVAGYVDYHGVLHNPLLDAGYASIGCAPCTGPVAADEDPRSGRWAGQAKNECGIHGSAA